jgi:hypothetical protein|eukprot:7388751-Prymnesium_polylepis.1
MYGDNMTSYEVIYLTTLYWSLLMLLKSPHIDPDHILEKLFACVVVRRLRLFFGAVRGSFPGPRVIQSSRPASPMGAEILCGPNLLSHAPPQVVLALFVFAKLVAEVTGLFLAFDKSNRAFRDQQANHAFSWRCRRLEYSCMRRPEPHR